jgi:hypothetical protein
MKQMCAALSVVFFTGCSSILDLPAKQEDAGLDTTPDGWDDGMDALPDPYPDTGSDPFEDGLVDPAGDTSPDTMPDAPLDTGIDTAVDTGVDTAADTSLDVPVDGGEVEILCSRWNADRADLSEGTWTGSVSSCDPGDVTGGGRDNALTQVNLYRWIAELPPVTTDPTANADTQQCALMMHANGSLSHSPPTSWTCYTAVGAGAAGSSNIASGPGVSAVDMYMSDWGNASTMGHRRWILSEGLGPIGLGSTSSYSCMQVIHWPSGGTWTAWPSPGYFPIQAMDTSWVGIDETGWTLQSNTIPLSSASVTVTRAGTPLPVDVTVLSANYGSQYAISFVPSGWASAAGQTYHVEVTGVSSPISYDVHMVDCS